MPPDTTPAPRPPLQLAGSPPLDPYQREYYEARWRSCMTELHAIAHMLGWENRLPIKPDNRS